ncbi:Sphingomyelin phosphodiesterase 4 [Fasciola hepatica]|uniref:Sphingomyelin phosphodiesterase 4 n=1 Tax=Fasciola hepatica TaxID=6192 RepID=A0A4E0R8S9_FASHE|nr:Sphingomyelin phosphodiesterase 4 [Fasciola hepatica]
MKNYRMTKKTHFRALRFICFQVAFCVTLQLLFLMSLKPSCCHIYIVRCFVKHLYHAAFNHMIPQSLTTPYQQALWNKISNFHKQLANSLCQQPIVASNNQQNLTTELRQLLLHCFQHWPYDLSFEIVLETWLTAIQPWRYADSPQPCGSSSPILDTTDPCTLISARGSVAHQFSTWVSFAAAQHSLYSAPLLLFLQRAVCMDLRVTRNAYMVHRVVKVLSQRGFKNMLHSAEETLSQDALSNLKGNGIELYKTMANGEKTSLWSPVFCEAASRLIQAAQSSQMQVHASLVQKSETIEAINLWGRIWNFVHNLLLDNGNRELKHLHKCDQYLNEMIIALKTFFLTDQDDISSSHMTCTIDPSISGRLQWDDATESPLIPVGRVRPARNAQTPPRRVQFIEAEEFSRRPAASSITDHNTPQQPATTKFRYSLSDGSDPASPQCGSELTPFDRFQILMGLRKPDVRFTGDRDFLPPCSYEVPVLVELFNTLSGYLNIRMRSRFMNWCSQSGFTGWAARQILLPASSQITSEPFSSPSSSVCSDLNPKISLRWLASYTSLVRFVLLYFIVFVLFGIRSPVSFVVTVLGIYLLYKFLRLAVQYARETVVNYCSR